MTQKSVIKNALQKALNKKILKILKIDIFVKYSCSYFKISLNEFAHSVVSLTSFLSE